MEPISDEKIEEIFSFFDKNGDETLDATEIQKALQLLCIDLSVEELQAYDVDGDLTFNKDEFRTFISERFDLETFDPEGRVRESLKEFDVDDTGRLTREQLENILRRGDSTLDDDTINTILNEFDVNGDGVYSIIEMAALLYSPNKTAPDAPEAEA